MRHQLKFDCGKEAQLCLVQAGGWINFYQREPIFVFPTAKEKNTYMTLMVAQAADEKRRRRSEPHEPIEEGHYIHEMFAQSE
ncbi:hypothetical protein WAX46_05610 [Bacillus sp. FJAT-53060]